MAPRWILLKVLFKGFMRMHFISSGTNTDKPWKRNPSDLTGPSKNDPEQSTPPSIHLLPTWLVYLTSLFGANCHQLHILSSVTMKATLPLLLLTGKPAKLPLGEKRTHPGCSVRFYFSHASQHVWSVRAQSPKLSGTLER